MSNINSMNADRASWALTALQSFSNETGAELYDQAIGDLICDLAHLCDRLGFDFQSLCAKAIGTWKIEQSDPVGVASPPGVTIMIEDSSTNPAQPRPIVDGSQAISVITVIKGGILQSVSCPDPSFDINIITLDYDLAQGDDTDLQILVDSLDDAVSEEERLGSGSVFRADRDRFAQQLLERRAITPWKPVTNAERADWAAIALAAFAETTGTDIGDGAFHDLLCDLGHYADHEKFDFRAELQRALDAWVEERSEQEQAAT